MSRVRIACVAASLVVVTALTTRTLAQIGVEVAVPVHLQDGQEYTASIRQLIRYGEQLFTAMWTVQEGAGRPLTKGTGSPLSDPATPLVFPRQFNRVSAPDTNSCSGCHNKPVVGGGGDIVGNVFVLAQRFDFATFDPLDGTPTRGMIDEIGRQSTLQTIANSRKTIGMSGSGFIEMLARQITADLQAIRDALPPGAAGELKSKGISFGVIARRADGTWDVSRIAGIPAPSLQTTGANAPPSLIIRPFHQAGNVISLRQFTNNAYNHHHGIQSEERFGAGVDADGDGFVNELTRADVTAVTLFQATMAVPGRVISRDHDVREAVIQGEQKFGDIGCTSCHVPKLPLTAQGWIFSEPNPYNPAGNLRPGDAPPLNVDLTSNNLPQPRLNAVNGVVWVPAYTDLKLHDITSGPNDPNREPLDMNQTAGTPAFFAGNSMFLTRKLWGIANQHSYGHHGLYTTMREAVLAHAGEADASRQAFEALSDAERNAVIEFLKSLQILPPGTRSLCVDEDGDPVGCPQAGSPRHSGH
ncbi:MAG TPA: di-heme oxidoredictase family protein [Vicinamibacterales bacterium]|nr:di-heme oxidoredictase family protein [Vicinamibacterales bacterium]